MGLLHIHHGYVVIYTGFPFWVGFITEQDPEWKPFYHHIQGIASCSHQQLLRHNHEQHGSEHGDKSTNREKSQINQHQIQQSARTIRKQQSRNTNTQLQVPKQSSKHHTGSSSTRMQNKTSGGSQSRPKTLPYIREHEHHQLLPSSTINILRPASSINEHKPGFPKDPSCITTGFPHRNHHGHGSSIKFSELLDKDLFKLSTSCFNGVL